MLSKWAARFNPLVIPNLAIWLDARDSSTITKDGSDLVATWANKGSAGNATQATGVNKPKWIASAINGKPAIQGRHDGTNASSLAISDGAALDYTRFTIFTVLQRVTDLGASEHVAGKYTTTGNQREFRQIISSADQVAGNASSDGTSGTVVAPGIAGALAVGTPVVHGAYYDGTNLNIERNAANTAQSAIAAVFNGTSPFLLFSRDGNAEPFAGYIGEVLFYTSILTAAQRNHVYGAYLAPKWGL